MTFSHIASVVILACTSGVALAGAQNMDEQSKIRSAPGLSQDIRVTLSSESRSLSLADEVTFDVSLRNDGSEPLFLYNRIGWGAAGGLILKIEDEHGKTVTSPVIDDTLLPPPDVGNLSILVRLEEGQFFGVRRTSRVGDLVSRPGHYRFRVSYESVLYPDLVDKDLRNLRILWEGHPLIQSGWVTVDIRP